MEELQSELYENDLLSSKIETKSEVDLPDSADSRAVAKKEIKRKEHKKRSYIWKFYRSFPNNKCFECIICNRLVGVNKSNLYRHLKLMHSEKRLSAVGEENKKKGSSSKSFIWKYCTKETEEYARCHLCKKLFYFGGGNTGNISKHLWRRHYNTLQEIQNCDPKKVMKVNSEYGYRSYVWKYVSKISRQFVKCKLCERQMRFHGTANLIVHLKRLHNVTGKTDEKESNKIGSSRESNTSEKLMNSCALPAGESTDENDTQNKRKRGGQIRSMVWKYYKRISTDIVECIICKKEFVKQGTSNLRRHLERWHGDPMQTKAKKSIEYKKNGYEERDMHDDDFIKKFCTSIDEELIKCSICDETFNKTAKMDIMHHLKGKHNINSKSTMGNVESSPKYTETESSNDEEEDEPINEIDIKRDSDAIDALNYENFGDSEFYSASHAPDLLGGEKIFEPQSNPLSPRSSPGRFVHVNESSSIGVNSNKALQKLNEERLKAETEYFREKASFYRMQKYLTALQAKKVRVEIEEFNRQRGKIPMETNRS